MIIKYNFNDDDYEDFEYEVCSSEVIDPILEKMSKEELLKFIREDLDIKEYLEAYFEDEIREAFERDAYEQYCDSKSQANEERDMWNWGK